MQDSLHSKQGAIESDAEEREEIQESEGDNSDVEERARKVSRKEAELRRLGSVLGTGSRYYSYTRDHISDRNRRARKQGRYGYAIEVDETAISSSPEKKVAGCSSPSSQTNYSGRHREGQQESGDGSSSSVPRTKRRRVPTARFVEAEEDDWERFEVRNRATRTNDARPKAETKRHLGQSSSSAILASQSTKHSSANSKRTTNPSSLPCSSKKKKQLPASSSPLKQRPSKSLAAKRSLKFSVEVGQRLVR